ncbi:Ig-like domain-containing protein [candidate division KSB1 bacterium]|nr:Ig-like domain-containing protein [candidate division KSB1 bacterium]
MLKKGLFGLILSLFLLGYCARLDAQPRHDRLLHHVPMTSDAPNPIGDISDAGGEYTERGWTPTLGNGQFRVDLKSFLPFEGTLQVTISGLMPRVDVEWIPIALYSRGSGSFYEVDPSPGSYIFLKSDDHYQASGYDFKFFSAAFYGANENSKRKDTPIYSRSWSFPREYVFKIIWNQETVWLMLDDEMLAVQAFKGQVESFGYIFLGTDDTYQSSVRGVYYKDLKIYVPDTNYPFANIADPYAEMAHRKIGGQGVSLSDINKNGAEDIYISNFFNSGHDVDNLLYVQNNASFNEEGIPRGVNDPSYSTQSLIGDFDADGDNDIFVVNFHRSPDYSNGPNHLYINDGTGNFIDRTINLENNTPYDSKGATMLDIENDGDLDVVVINSASQHQVYVNDGAARFTVQTRGLENFRSASRKYKGAVSGDLNKDGYQDLVIVHDSGLSIAKNDGSGTFRSAAELSVPASANSASLIDIDRDADLDILVGVHASDYGRIEMFRNEGNYTFSNISSLQEIPISSYGAIPGDWNNDGHVDLFAIERNGTGKLYLNDSFGKFSEKKYTGVEAQFIDGRGAATLDVNDDGRLDIYAISHGSIEIDDESREEKPYNRNYLFRNDIPSVGNYLKIKTIDEFDNATGIGNKLYVYKSGQLNSQAGLLGYREIISTNGFNSQSSLVQHFGVGNAASVDVKIILPDGSEKIYTNVPTNQTMVVSPVRIIPERLERDTDESQQAIVGQSYELAYTLYSSENEFVPDHPVTFEVVQGNGSLEHNANVTTKTVNTNQSGRAAVSWTLGPVAGLGGINQVRVSSSYEGVVLQGSPDDFSVIAEPGDPKEILKTSGDAQSGYINIELANELVARVVDEFGNGVPAHPVEFTIAEGGGTLISGGSSATQITINTDNNGHARMRWQLGAQLGQQKVYARATQQGVPLKNSPLTFTATAQQPLRKLLYSSGDYQSAPANTRLAHPFVVRLLDANNNPVSSEDIKFVATTGGHFSGADSIFVKTDSQGYGRATATLGSTIGDTVYVFKAYAQNASGSPVTFKASATAGPPAKVTYLDGNNQSGPAGRYLPNSLKVKVTDTSNYPVQGHDVQFNVTEGNGKVNGVQTATVQTDAQGVASVKWKLGETVGSNSVVATASGLSVPGVNFKAQGVVGPPARLSKYGGDQQKGEAGQPLPEYFVVSVTDSFYNAVVNHPVTFTVLTGGGNLNGRSQVTEYTNAFGQAKALLTMGPTAFEQTVQASGENNSIPLIGSPQIFYAYLGPGDPESLEQVSGNHQIGAVNQDLPQPFVVKVQDKNGIGVANIEVEFVTFSQGATFGGSPNIKVRSDTDGLAKATATLGSNFGNNNYVFEAIAKYNGKHLKGSPKQFYASGRKSLAKKIQKLNGDQAFVGTVGQFLGDSLQVLVTDENNNPVKDHPVTFQVQQGLALVEGKYTNHVVPSNNKGVASVLVKLGTRPGISLIRASSDDGVNPLTPAFLDFTITAETGPASASTSTISATSGVIADGQTVSDVQVVLLDAYQNPVVGKFVMLQAAGIDVLISQPNQSTNENGATMGSITSINIGTATIWALVDNQPLISSQIDFIPGPPALVLKRNDGQTGEKGKPLPQPVGVFVQDAYSHPIKGLSVNFTVKRGKGSLVEPQPVLTDEEGKAMVHWTLGDSLGEQKLAATVDGVPTAATFTAFAIPPSDGFVKVFSGDSLIALVNQLLPQPFKVRVTDKYDNQITNIPVEFQIITPGGGTWQTASRVATDQNGIASAQLRAGSQTGMFQVMATVTNYGSVIFNYLIEAQRTVHIVKHSKEGESVRPKTELPVVIQVLDGYNRPLNQESITFTQVQGQSYVKEALPLQTNTDGMLTAMWILGTSGVQQMEIKAVNATHPQTFFTAVVVNGAPYFEPQLQKNIATDAGEQVHFIVNAIDPDGDTVYYLARQLPGGAQFDKDNTHSFTWTPATSQAGEHAVTFVIMDEYGASDSSVVHIVVDIRNRPPNITSFSPTDTVQVVPFGTQMTFQVNAEDPNGDVLNYEWTVNDEFASDTYVLPLVFTRATFPDSFAVVKVRVYDDYNGERYKTWRIHMQKITFVELSSFAATAKDNKVRLVWNTTKENGTAGFYILKSSHKDGPFIEINKDIIKPQKGGEYSFIDEDIAAGQKYYYKLKEIDVYGMTAEYGLVEAEVKLPTRLALAQNYPNPFNPTTTIRFELPAPHKVQIAVFNTTGQLVRMLVDGEYVAGVHQVTWDAKDERGLKVPSGIYYYRMQTDGFHEMKKLLLLK